MMTVNMAWTAAAVTALPHWFTIQIVLCVCMADIIFATVFFNLVNQFAAPANFAIRSFGWSVGVVVE